MTFDPRNAQPTTTPVSNVKFDPANVRRVGTLSKPSPTATGRPETPQLGLPGYHETERRIAERRHPVDILREEVTQPWQWQKHPYKSVMRPLVTGLKFFNIPFQAARSAVANPLMEVQAHSNFGNVAKSAVQGLTGERQGELRDVYERFGLPPAVSTVLGIFGELGVANAATKGKVANAIRKRLLRKGSRKLLRSSEDANVALDAARKELGEGVGKFFEGPAGDAIGNADEFYAALEKLPKDVLDDVLTNLDDLTPTARNMQKARNIVDDILRDTDWTKAGSRTKEAVKGVYRQLGGNVRKALPAQAEQVYSRYHKFMDDFRDVKKVLTDNRGKPIANKLKSLWRSGGEPRTREAFERLYDDVPQLMDVTAAAQNYNRAQAMKNAALRYGPLVGAGGAMGYYAAGRMGAGVLE